MDVFNGCFFNSAKEINRLRKEMNKLLSKGSGCLNGCSLIQLNK